MTSAARNNSVIGAARASMENGSVEGVAMAPKTKVPKITRVRYFASVLALITPDDVQHQYDERDQEGDPEDQHEAQQEGK